MSNKTNLKPSVPRDGWQGFKQNLLPDATSGFVVFLLALPLSLGIAAASEFPPIMGLLTAIIGGLLATFFTGSQLAIKGPAAGLIVIVAEAVTEFGGGTEGWHLALGVMVVAAIIQILFGLLKWGKFVDIFPLSAVHGMLAAIGFIIIAKQIPVLLNVDPALSSGKGPLALLGAIPGFFMNLDPQVSIIGGISLAIMLGWGFVKHPVLKKIPAPLLVLLFAIPTGLYMNLGATAPDYTLVKVGKLTEQIGVNVSMSGVHHLSVFIKFVIMVALVGSLESLLTVKAIDMMDPWKRKADPNKDMISVGIANSLSAILGGLPMISEVARSSANVAQGGRTRWANFFHGLFLLVSVLLAYRVLELIPNAALAAMLIAVGIKLAHPKEFIHMLKVGPEQLAIFVTTIFFTLFEDLLVGIAAGMGLKAIIHIFRGASFKSLFRSGVKVEDKEGDIILHLGDSAVFTNYLGIKDAIEKLPDGKSVIFDFAKTVVIDHSVMENLHHFGDDYRNAGGKVEFVGLDSFTPSSSHPSAARRRSASVYKPTNTEWAIEDNSAVFNEEHLLELLKHYLPSQAALKDFVHHNPLHAFQDREFFDAIFSASKVFGIKTTFSLNEYRKLSAHGRIKASIIDRVIGEEKGVDNIEDWRQKMLHGKYTHIYDPRIGRLRSEWKQHIKFSLDDRVHPLLFRLICSYLDQGIAVVHFPFEDTGLIEAIRTIEKNSFTSFFKTSRARNLLLDDSVTLESLLDTVVGNKAFYEQYVFDQQFAHKGWSGIINAIEDQPGTLLYQKKIELRDFVMLELLLEVDALERELGKNWQPLCSHVIFPPENYFADVPAGEMQEVLKLWQLAFEWDYYDEVLTGVGHLNKLKRSHEQTETSFQALFCVDDRECSIRRHLESVDPQCETYGAPGFFGAAIYFQPCGGQFYEKNCPVPITPKHLIREIETTRSHGTVPFHDKSSHTFVRGFLSSLSLGLISSFRMVVDLFRPTMRPDIADAFSHMDLHGKLLIECEDPSKTEDGLQVGFTVPEMIEIVEGILRGVGLTKNFADVVYIVAHGSSSANNPHHGAHDCGACCGRPGAPNARVFSFMANHLEVRLELGKRGIAIPETTQFLAGMHDTASDEIAFYDQSTLSSTNQQKHEVNIHRIEDALDLNAKERARRFASIDTNQGIKKIRKAIKDRSVSYFEPRPELGHGTNALCFIGSRHRMKGLFLDRRAFLQSYDYQQDPEGEVLAKVIAPLPGVCGGINLEYYFSRMDIEKMGAGTKLPHNVVGLIGVTNSSDGDLRPGLPLQMIENHDPVRLLMVVEHRPEVVLQILANSPENLEWFEKGWVHLVVSSPEDGELYYFKNGGFQEYQPMGEVSNTADIQNTIDSHPGMRSNHILDATRENISVHIYGDSK